MWLASSEFSLTKPSTLLVHTFARPIGGALSGCRPRQVRRRHSSGLRPFRKKIVYFSRSFGNLPSSPSRTIASMAIQLFLSLSRASIISWQRSMLSCVSMDTVTTPRFHWFTVPKRTPQDGPVGNVLLVAAYTANPEIPGPLAR